MKYLISLSKYGMTLLLVLIFSTSFVYSESNQIHKLIYNENINNNNYSLLISSLLLQNDMYDKLAINIEDSNIKCDFIMTIEDSERKSLFIFAPYNVDSEKIFKESMSLIPINLKINLSLINKIGDDEIINLIFKGLEASNLIDKKLIDLQRAQRNLSKSLEETLSNTEFSKYTEYIEIFFQKEQFDFLHLIKNGQKIDLSLDSELIKLADFLQNNITDSNLDYLNFVDKIKNSPAFSNYLSTVINSINSINIDEANSLIEKVKENIDRFKESINIDFDIKKESNNLFEKIKNIISGK